MQGKELAFPDTTSGLQLFCYLSNDSCPINNAPQHHISHLTTVYLENRNKGFQENEKHFMIPKF